MTLTARRRRTTDRLVALVLALLVAAVGTWIYLTSDNRATADITGHAAPIPDAATAVPTSLRQVWTAATDATLGAVVSPLGVVVTTARHGVSALDASTGRPRWSYTRANRDLCTAGTGDTQPTPMSQGGGVRGIATVFEENGYCSQLMTLDAVTGDRSKVRISPLPAGGSLAFGDPYAGWLSPQLVEVWRNDLVRTIQYGVQPNPTNPSSSHEGCTITDLALAQTQFATVEHCAAKGATARVVLNYDDPGAQKSKEWDQFRHTARMDVDTRSAAAVLVGVTADRVAALVSSPTPAVVVYDVAGTQVSRSPVDIPASGIVAAAAAGRPVPAVQTADQRFSLIGDRLLAVGFDTVQGPPPVTTTAGTTASAAPTTSGGLGLDPATSATATAADVPLASMRVDWVAPGVLGLPAVIDTRVLLPVTGGLRVVDAGVGPSTLGGPIRLAVDRGGWTGRVDATSVGAMVIETRGPTVAALR